MEIKIYNSSLLRQGIIENAKSLIWTRKYYEPGNFELHVPLTDANIQLLNKNNLIAKDGSDEAGIIEELTYSDSHDDKSIIAKGRFLSSLLDRRLIKQTYSFSGKTEDAMRALIGYVVAIPGLILGDYNGFNETVIFQATMKELLSIMIKLSKTSGIGFRIIPDFVNKQMIFETYKGVDRSLGQTDNSRVIFAEEFSNIDQIIYTWNNQLLKTYAVIGGEGEGASRTYVTIGSGTGLDLREVFVDAKEIRSEDFSSQSEYEDALKQKGYEALEQDIESESFDCVSDPNANFVYKEDYDLGDIVTIKKKNWNIELDIRITEVQEIYENGGMTVVPTFGYALPDTVDWSE